MAQIFDEAQHIKDSFSIEQIKEMWSSAIPNNMKNKIKVWIHDFKQDPLASTAIILSAVLVYGLLAYMILAFMVYLYNQFL